VSGLALHPDAAAMGFHRELAESQAQAVTDVSLVQLHWAELLEDDLMLFRRNSGTRVRDGYTNLVTVAGHRQGNLPGLGSEFIGIGQQSHQHPAYDCNSDSGGRNWGAECGGRISSGGTWGREAGGRCGAGWAGDNDRAAGR